MDFDRSVRDLRHAFAANYDTRVSHFAVGFPLQFPFSLQDSIDLFLGNYIVEPSEGITKPSPLHKKREWRYLLVT